MTARRRMPADLQDRGKRFWRTVTKAFEDIDETEFELLVETCRTLDVIDQLEEAIDRDGLMLKGSTGQTVVNPAVAEARAQRQTLHRLLGALAIPDEGGATLATVETLRARQAADARWQGHVKDAG